MRASETSAGREVLAPVQKQICPDFRNEAAGVRRKGGLVGGVLHLQLCGQGSNPGYRQFKGILPPPTQLERSVLPAGPRFALD